MAWFKVYEGAVNDPKFRWCARHTGQPKAYVLAVWSMLLDRASEADERGSIDGADCEAWDAELDMPDGAACAIIEAMRLRGLISDDNRLTHWEKRQGQKATTTGKSGSAKSSTERSREYRARQAQRHATDATQCNGDATDATPCNGCNGDATDATPCNGIDKNRIDKKREEKDRKAEEACAERNAGGVASTPTPPPAVLDVAITLPLNTGQEHPVTYGEVEQWQDLYPAIDVLQSLRNMRGWLLGNPRNRKTDRGIGRFVQAWLRGDQDKAPPARSSPPFTDKPKTPTEYQYRQQISREMAASLLAVREAERTGEIHA